jgi:hypothetical protein
MTPKLRLIVEEIFWLHVIAAFLLSVTAANMLSQWLTGGCVNISSKSLSGIMAGRAQVLTYFAIDVLFQRETVLHQIK